MPNRITAYHDSNILNCHLCSSELAIDTSRHMLVYKDDQGTIYDITSDEAAIAAAQILMNKFIENVAEAKEILRRHCENQS